MRGTQRIWSKITCEIGLLIKLLDVEVSPLLQREHLGFEEDSQLEDDARLDYVGVPELDSELEREPLKVFLEDLECPPAASAAGVNVDHAIFISKRDDESAFDLLLRDDFDYMHAVLG